MNFLCLPSVSPDIHGIPLQGWKLTLNFTRNVYYAAPRYNEYPVHHIAFIFDDLNHHIKQIKTITKYLREARYAAGDIQK